MGVATAAVPSAAAAEGVGEVSFANSGSPAAQEPFLRGLALLHNFEYPDAAEQFRKAQKIDPDFAMAYWGEAMTYTHPVWMQQDLEAARAALGRLGATPEARRGEGEDRARARLPARRGGPLRRRHARRSATSATPTPWPRSTQRYPDDVDATAFYALSLLGTAHQGRDFAIYMRSAALLEEVFPTHPHHPGVLHYLIHSYDDPVHAPLGMRAARLYGAVAPNAGHALHMTSHIFVALGLWDDVIAANEQAMRVVDQHRARPGQPPKTLRPLRHLAALRLPAGAAFDDAQRQLDACHEEASRRAARAKAGDQGDGSYEGADSYAEMRLRHFVDAGRSPTAR